VLNDAQFTSTCSVVDNRLAKDIDIVDIENLEMLREVPQGFNVAEVANVVDHARTLVLVKDDGV
jgi:hypothetical protein